MGGLQCFPLPPQTGNWHRVEFNQSSFARGPGSDPITTRWQCSPGRSHAPPAHPLFNQGADKAVIFFPPPRSPQRAPAQRLGPQGYAGVVVGTGGSNKDQRAGEGAIPQPGGWNGLTLWSSVLRCCLLPLPAMRGVCFLQASSKQPNCWTCQCPRVSSRHEDF